jgi:NAD(P)-dependent dehydrogenase (short-subunit alcohol dehydrogenase family)
MNETLNGRVVLITGATGGLGTAVVGEFAKSGAQLVLSSHSPDDLKALLDETGLDEERAIAIAADLTAPAEVEDTVRQVLDRFGRLDVLLNTVGGWRGGETVGETPLDAWHGMIALNLHSAYYLSRAVLPPMLDAGWGRIIHVSSKSAVEPKAKQAAYAVSKMALITLTEVIAAEIKGSGVTANVILPSTIDTPGNRKMMGQADTSKWVPPERLAAAMRFLCSEAGASINGVRLPIYGEL